MHVNLQHFSVATLRIRCSGVAHFMVTTEFHLNQEVRMLFESCLLNAMLHLNMWLVVILAGKTGQYHVGIKLAPYL
jgi:hypothetical protein